MKHPRDIIGPEQLAALREAGWIVVREDAIRLAQAFAREECQDEIAELDAEAEKWRSLCFKRGALLDEIGPAIWEKAASRLEANRA